MKVISYFFHICLLRFVNNFKEHVEHERYNLVASIQFESEYVYPWQRLRLHEIEIALLE